MSNVKNLDKQQADTAQDEAEIRAMAEAWTKALEAKDIKGLTANYADDVVFFDVKPPYKVQGVEGYRALWEACLPCFPAKFKSERRDLKISVSGDVAFLHCLNHIKPIGEDKHPAGHTWIRVTVCFRKINGSWKVAHEHVSVPFDPMTEKVAYITNPDSLDCDTTSCFPGKS